MSDLTGHEGQGIGESPLVRGIFDEVIATFPTTLLDNAVEEFANQGGTTQQPDYTISASTSSVVTMTGTYPPPLPPVSGHPGSVGGGEATLQGLMAAQMTKLKDAKEKKRKARKLALEGGKEEDEARLELKRLQNELSTSKKKKGGN